MISLSLIQESSQRARKGSLLSKVRKCMFFRYFENSENSCFFGDLTLPLDVTD